MSLTRVQYVGHLDVFLLHGLDNLIGLGLIDLRVVGSLGNQQRTLNLAYVGQWRAMLQERPTLLGPVVAHPGCQQIDL